MRSILTVYESCDCFCGHCGNWQIFSTENWFSFCTDFGCGAFHYTYTHAVLKLSYQATCQFGIKVYIVTIIYCQLADEGRIGMLILGEGRLIELYDRKFWLLIIHLNMIFGVSCKIQKFTISRFKSYWTLCEENTSKKFFLSWNRSFPLIKNPTLRKD